MRLTLLTNVFPSPIAPTKGTFNLELAKELAREHELTAVVPVAWTDELIQRVRSGKRMPRTREMESAGIPTLFPRFWYPPRGFYHRYDRFLAWSLKRTLGKLAVRARPDVVLGYWAHPDGAVAVRWAHELGVPGWIMVGGSDVLLLAKNRKRGDAIFQALNEADGVIAVSRDLAEELVGRGVPSDKVHVVYRGVDGQRFCPGDKIEARRKLRLPEKRRLFLWVGRMVDVKGLDVLLDAVALARSRNQARSWDTDCCLYLIGDGPRRAALEAAVARMGLQQQVQFVGAVPHAQLATWYQAADWTVLSSRSEGVPNVLLESHACGTPFIATAVGGVSEIAVAGADRLVPAADAEAFAEALAAAGPTESSLALAAKVSSMESSARAIAELLTGRSTASKRGGRSVLCGEQTPAAACAP